MKRLFCALFGHRWFDIRVSSGPADSTRTGQMCTRCGFWDPA